MLNKIIKTFSFLKKEFLPKHINANVCVIDSNELLHGKRIIVTGGGRGLGYFIAKKCISEGANVIITGRNEQTLIDSSKELNCGYVLYDVTDFSNIKNFFADCEKIFGGVADCLVNNAGISLHENNIFNVTEESFDKQFDTNLKAPYFLSKEFAERFVSSDLESGSILFITSERGFYGDDIPYGLIKASINSLTEGLGRRLIKNKIRVNAVAPGVTASDMTGYDKNGNLYRSQASSERVYLPEEVAEVACFLLSDAAGCISSHIVPCNNGNHLRCDW